jgi:uncharacterized FlaG/YvyC family protein
MQICYWQLCHCPDATPCGEHNGFHCSEVNGAIVTDETKIKDSVTNALEAALLMFDKDQVKIDATKTTLETQRSMLEREKDEIERDAKAAKNRAERQAVAERAERTNERIKKLADEISKITDELEAMNTRWQIAIATGSNRLILPYTDTSGYCACYNRKTQRLAVIATSIANEQANYGAALAQYNSINAAALAYLTDVRNWKGGFVTAAIFAAWFYLGIGETAALAILVGLIVIALALLALNIYMFNLLSRMEAAEKRLAALILMYYRLQQISTCKKEGADADDDSSWFDSLFDWLENPEVSHH